MSYGYEPPKQDREGSWADIFALTKVAFIALAVPLAAIVLIVGLVMSALIALFSNPPLALIPIAILGAGVAYVLRRDRRTQEQLREEIHGPRGGRGAPRPPR